MDIRFQDKIDDYLLNRMNDADKKAFLDEVEQDDEKKEQLEFTRNVKDAVCSREEKLKVLAQLQQKYKWERRSVSCCSAKTEGTIGQRSVSTKPSEHSMTSKKKIWLWISGIAAVLLVGFFAARSMFMVTESPDQTDIGTPAEQMRGDDKIFNIQVSPDSMSMDTTTVETDSIVTSDE